MSVHPFQPQNFSLSFDHLYTYMMHFPVLLIQINKSKNQISTPTALINVVLINRDTQWRSWLRHCATSRKVAGSIPVSVTGISH